MTLDDPVNTSTPNRNQLGNRLGDRLHDEPDRRPSSQLRRGSDRRRQHHTALTLVAIGALVFSGCSGSDGGDRRASDTKSKSTVDRKAALASIADDVIVPGLEELSTQTGKLLPALEAHCAGPTPESLTTAQSAWDAAADAWAATAAFRFGPGAKLRSAAGISYPINATKIEKLFAPGGDFATTTPTPELVADMGADKRGLGAIEYLLFAPSDAEAMGIDDGGEQCAFAVAAAQDVDTNAKALAQAWTTGSSELDHPGPFSEQFRVPGSKSMYGNQQEAIDDAINAMSSALQGVGDMILGEATGKTSGEPDPAGADPGHAQRRLGDAKASLSSVMRVFGNGDERLSGVVAAQSSKADNDAGASFMAALENAQAELDRVPKPIAMLTPEAASSGPLAEAFKHVNDARVVLRTEVASQLGVTIGFSDADGDG